MGCLSQRWWQKLAAGTCTVQQSSRKAARALPHEAVALNRLSLCQRRVTANLYLCNLSSVHKGVQWTSESPIYRKCFGFWCLLDFRHRWQTADCSIVLKLWLYKPSGKLTLLGITTCIALQGVHLQLCKSPALRFGLKLLIFSTGTAAAQIIGTSDS